MARSDDPGLQVERTTLAWIRTAMSFAVVSLLLIRASRPETVVVAVVLALAGLAASLGLGLVQRARHRGRVTDFNHSDPVHGPRAVAVGTGLTVLLAFAALWCVWS
ncbi:DUF202 domain-containing protein [Kineosporia sp. J2-2]|uniref:DUF202 domain-containing protein n=1 Tax=Kineosporia corallincola TaxID=2835133 RepID=A0ABS5TND7_9ACTN|nr:DUF202 domain-containing protein [Kineosporia corallincola]MBT0771899.1 DUF202 domain-containing protein [Kineosporia corallincola]